MLQPVKYTPITQPKGVIMKNTMKYFFIFMIVTSLVVASFGGAFALEKHPFTEKKDTTAGFMVLDALMVRPLGLGATILGTAVFVLALPFTAPTGYTKKSYDKLMADPAKYTFTRPLGFF